MTWNPDELEKVPCDSCGGREARQSFVRADGMLVVECAVCGLAYLSPRPLADFISRFYEADYFTGVRADEGVGGLRCNVSAGPTEVSEEAKSIPRVVEIINEKFGGFQKKSILEIGCATGDLLALLKSQGASVKGLEISEFAADVARQRGLDVSTGRIEEYVKSTSQRFDIVIGMEVIEHVTSPLRFLDHVSELLREGGLLVLSTPNYLCTKRYREEWFGFQTSFEHLYYFSLPVLSRLARDAGLSVAYSESSRFLGDCRNNSSNRLARRYQRLKKLLEIVNEIGLLGTMGEIGNMRRGFLASAIGHQLVVVFQWGGQARRHIS